VRSMSSRPDNEKAMDSMMVTESAAVQGRKRVISSAAYSGGSGLARRYVTG
jgi:hypothetical protein